VNEMIPMVDMKLQYQNLRGEIEPAVLTALENAQYVMGPSVGEFEKEAAQYLGVKHALGVANGTDALYIALLATGIKPGDEVITPSFTFIATVEAILYADAVPVFVDIDPENFNLSLAAVKRAITPKTKAIMPVHLYGQPVNMDKLMEIAEESGLKVIEDCAQSFGASCNKKMTGTFGTCSSFSFYPSKNLSCFGDGGLLATDSDDVAREIVALRNHGSYIRYHHAKLGFNSRLDEIQAAILRVKLRHIDSFNLKRAAVAKAYSEMLDGKVVVPKVAEGARHIFHQYTILHPDRDRIAVALKEKNIGSMIYYPIPIHRQELFNGMYDSLSLPVTEDFTRRCLSLPIFPEMTIEQIERVVAVIKSVV
jgi:dTDP-4-amino-4,6-dideoxygalactose transaminase